jgi:DNA-binding response OmpR family regulator
MGLQILLVEDHNDTREALGRLLRYFGYQVHSADTCQTASHLLESRQFQVLLSDIGLPDGNGCDVVSEAKQKQQLVGIAITAFSSACDIKRGLNAGFDYYLTKPLDVSSLRTLLTEIEN